MTNEGAISVAFGKQVATALSEESDRACVILLASWVDHLLRIKFAREFSEGNASARAALFASNGPFATFSAKLNAAFCANWVDADVYHDLQVVRRLRNEFAHSIESHTLLEEPFPAMVASLRVPRRQYYDWGQVRAAATERGIALFAGERPDDAKEDLNMSKITFRIAASVIMAVLVANLAIPINFGGPAGTRILELPEHMREIAE